MAANRDGVIYVPSGCLAEVASCTFDIQSDYWFHLKYCKQLGMNFSAQQIVSLGNIITSRTSSEGPQKIVGSIDCID
jgi:hypothetical protein